MILIFSPPYSSSMFSQELCSPLIIEKTTFSLLSDEYLGKIKEMVKISYSVKPENFCHEICVNLDKFSCFHPFPIQIFVPLWWVQVRSSLQDSLLCYVKESTYVNMCHRPSSGVFNFTQNAISPSVNNLLLKGIKFSPESPLPSSCVSLSIF